MASKRRPLVGSIRTMHAERIKLTVRRARYKRMPVVIGAMDAWIERNHTRGPRVIHVVEQAQFDTFTVLSEYAEIGAPVTKRGPQWETAALRDGLVHLCPPPRRFGGCQIGEDERVVLAHAAGGNPAIASLKAREYPGLIAPRNNPEDVAGIIECWICQRHAAATLVFAGQRDRHVSNPKNCVTRHQRGGVAIGPKAQVNKIESSGAIPLSRAASWRNVRPRRLRSMSSTGIG